MEKIEFDVVTGESRIVNLTDDELAQLPPPQTDAEKLGIELKLIADAYQADLSQYRMLWTSVSITDGVSEETRKTNLRTQWTARTAQYSADVSATKLKYQ